jgi:hypothetical protein
MATKTTIETCDSCALTGTATPATTDRAIEAGAYQLGAERRSAHLCAECAEMHDQHEAIREGAPADE